MSWLIYTFATAVTVTAGASVAERALRSASRPARLVWALALPLSVGLPIAAVAGWTGVRIAAPEPVGFGRILETAATTGPSPLAMIVVAWGVVSVVALALIALHAHRIGRMARRWPVGSIAGIRVLVSPDTGPVTLGLVRPEIVVPVWLLGMDTRFRRLAVLHEQEHRRAGDVLLLHGMAVLVALVPWHPVLWWQAARLHRAIELDCDERVVRRVRDRSGYGRMLIEAATRRTRTIALAAGLGPHRPLLERRIGMLVIRPYHRAPPAMGALAAALLAFACLLPSPFEPSFDVRTTAGNHYRYGEPQPDSPPERPVGASRATGDSTGAGRFEFREVPPGDPPPSGDPARPLLSGDRTRPRGRGDPGRPTAKR